MKKECIKNLKENTWGGYDRPKARKDGVLKVIGTLQPSLLVRKVSDDHLAKPIMIIFWISQLIFHIFMQTRDSLVIKCIWRWMIKTMFTYLDKDFCFFSLYSHLVRNNFKINKTMVKHAVIQRMRDYLCNYRKQFFMK